METKRVSQKGKGPYWIGVAATILVLLLAVMAPRFWNAIRPNAAVDDSSAIEPPSTTQGEAFLTVSIAPHLFEDSQGEAGSPAPFSDESGADEFAIGVVEKVVRRRNSNYLPLKLTQVFKGQLPVGTFLAEDKMVVRIECSLPPKNLGVRSQLYKPGSNVVVYLRRDDAKRWMVASLVRFSPAEQEYWCRRLQTFADVISAGELDDPEKRFRELLVLQPNGGLEFTLYNAIMFHPHPAARPVVRKLWRERVKQYPVDPEESELVGALSLTYLMRTLKESEMLDEMLEHAMRQKPGQRGYYISQLRIHAEYSDADSRQRLKARLLKFLEDLPALETLDSVNDVKMRGDIANTKQALRHLEWLESNP